MNNWNDKKSDIQQRLKRYEDLISDLEFQNEQYLSLI